MEARIWNDTRTVNVNSPLNGLPTGPRAMGIANLNVLQVQNSGQGRATAVVCGGGEPQVQAGTVLRGRGAGEADRRYG